MEWLLWLVVIVALLGYVVLSLSGSGTGETPWQVLRRWIREWKAKRK